MVNPDGMIDDHPWQFTSSQQVVTVPAATLFCRATFGAYGVLLSAVYHNSQAVSGVIIPAGSFYIRAFGLFKVIVSSQGLPVSDDDDFEPLFDTENMDLSYGNSYPNLPDLLMSSCSLEIEPGLTDSYLSTVLLPYAQFSWFSMDDTHQFYRTDGHIYPSRRWFDFMFKQGPWTFAPFG